MKPSILLKNINAFRFLHITRGVNTQSHDILFVSLLSTITGSGYVNILPRDLRGR